ncbi:MAG: hypothetical protein U1E26_02120 [Coriobacteriia bacterium]|nr:hypothetical protein [Coriobacteriia bacterium]
MTSVEFWSSWWWPALTAVTGLVFAALVFAQWLARRKAHQLCWAVGLLMYAVAAMMEAWSEYTGVWDPTVYRIYIVLAASLVGYLGSGSAYLMIHKRRWVAHVYLAYNIVLTAIFLIGAFTAELRMEYLVPGITVGGQALGAPGSFPRYLSMFITIPGTFFLLGGAIVSVWRFARKKEYAYRMWANVLIAAGTVLIAWAGSLARAGQAVGLYPAEMVASALLLAGFLMAGDLKKGAHAAIEAGQQRRAAQAEAADGAAQRPDQPSS